MLLLAIVLVAAAMILFGVVFAQTRSLDALAMALLAAAFLTIWYSQYHPA